MNLMNYCRFEKSAQKTTGQALLKGALSVWDKVELFVQKLALGRAGKVKREKDWTKNLKWRKNSLTPTGNVKEILRFYIN